MAAFLEEQFSAPPTDRIATAFLRSDETIDSGARTLAAYDRFIEVLNDDQARQELEALDREGAKDSDLFRRVKEYGKTMEAGLLSLLFEIGDYAALSRSYLVF